MFAFSGERQFYIFIKQTMRKLIVASSLSVRLTLGSNPPEKGRKRGNEMENFVFQYCFD